MTVESTKAGFIAIIGAPNAGKSTFLNAVLGQKLASVTQKVQTTRKNMRGIFTDEENGVQYVFVDTPGIHKPKRLLDRAMVLEAHNAWTEADVIMLMVDAAKGFNEEVENILENLKENKKIPMVLVLNKVDKIKKEKLLPLMQRAHDMGIFKETFAIRADKNKGVDDVLKVITKHMPESEYLYDPDYITDTNMRDIAAEITREQAFLMLHEEIPYSVAVETLTYENFDNGDIKIHQNLLIERNSQKKIVVGRDGATLKRIGQNARRILEEMLECKVHLFLKVKVSEKWSENPHVMKSFGLEVPKD